MSTKVSSRKRSYLREETYFEHPPSYNADQRRPSESRAGTDGSNPVPSSGESANFGPSAEDAGFGSRLECHSSDSKIDRPGIGIDPVRLGQLHVGTGERSARRSSAMAAM